MAWRQNDTLWRKWQRHMRAVRGQVTWLLGKRLLYREMRAAAREQDGVLGSNLLLRWLDEIYLTDMTVTIRKLLDEDKRTYSLVVLLRELRDGAELITRRRFLGRSKGWMRTFLSGQFDKLAGAGANHLPKEVIDSDVAKLARFRKPIKKFVDNRVAHLERKAHQVELKLRELETCIDLIHEIALKYSTILLRESGTLEPVFVSDLQKHRLTTSRQLHSDKV